LLIGLICHIQLLLDSFELWHLYHDLVDLLADPLNVFGVFRVKFTIECDVIKDSLESLALRLELSIKPEKLIMHSSDQLLSLEMISLGFLLWKCIILKSIGLCNEVSWLTFSLILLCLITVFDQFLNLVDLVFEFLGEVDSALL